MIRVRKIENRAGKILKRVVFYMGEEIYRRNGFEREGFEREGEEREAF